MGGAAPHVSVIVPTLNEAENLPELARRVDAAMAGRPYELLVVDDNSSDGTPAVCSTLSGQFPLSLHVRERPADGLSGAVLAGFALARGEVLVVMDADLQHPPEALPQLLAPLERDEADFVIGSRHAAGGSVEGDWGALRRLNSRAATLLARPFCGAATDPMSGFFALRRATFERAERLTPLGYKIGLELMCKCRVRRVREVPIHFATRRHGHSKLSLREQFRYLEHLSRLYDFDYPRLSPAVKFLVATGCGWVLGLLPFLPLVRAGVSPARAAVVCYPVVTLTTAAFHWRYVRAQRGFLSTRTPWRDFAVVAAGEWAACAAAAAWAGARIPGAGPAEVFVLAFGAATVARYVLRKEMMQDIRGLRREARHEDVA